MRVRAESGRHYHYGNEEDCYGVRPRIYCSSGCSSCDGTTTTTRKEKDTRHKHSRSDRHEPKVSYVEVVDEEITTQMQPSRSSGHCHTSRKHHHRRDHVTEVPKTDPPRGRRLDRSPSRHQVRFVNVDTATCTPRYSSLSIPCRRNLVSRNQKPPPAPSPPPRYHDEDRRSHLSPRDTKHNMSAPVASNLKYRPARHGARGRSPIPRIEYTSERYGSRHLQTYMSSSDRPVIVSASPRHSADSISRDQERARRIAEHNAKIAARPRERREYTTRVPVENHSRSHSELRHSVYTPINQGAILQAALQDARDLKHDSRALHSKIKEAEIASRAVTTLEQRRLDQQAIARKAQQDAALAAAMAYQARAATYWR